jgi:hypothetical protein
MRHITPVRMAVAKMGPDDWKVGIVDGQVLRIPRGTEVPIGLDITIPRATKVGETYQFDVDAVVDEVWEDPHEVLAGNLPFDTRHLHPISVGSASVCLRRRCNGHGPDSARPSRRLIRRHRRPSGRAT